MQLTPCMLHVGREMVVYSTAAVLTGNFHRIPGGVRSCYGIENLLPMVSHDSYHT